MRYMFLLAGLLTLLLASTSAQAANSFIMQRSGLRAGPGDRYPELTVLSGNASVNLLGCLSGWNWCEVESRGLHGWVKAGHIGTVYRGRRVGLGNHWGPRIGITIVGFEERPYWDRYYSDRDFYIVRYGRHHNNNDWNHHNRHCNDRYHDRDCHVIVHHHDHDDDRDDNHWHHDDGRDNDWNRDSGVRYHNGSYNN